MIISYASFVSFLFLFKVRPLKLFYYQTLSDTWRNKKWDHRACLRARGLLKWGIFTGCTLKIRITFIQNQVLVTWKTQSSILKAKLYLLT